MTLAQPSSSLHSNIYAVVDLGSNSFHMMLVKVLGGNVQVIDRIRRKVRLAAGLDAQMQLSAEAMNRGWDCLTLFAERLQDLPASNVKVVGTATLRAAQNSALFVQRAEQILGHSLQIISGEDEARLIYKGVAYTSNYDGCCLVIDIGGASTEVVIGYDDTPMLLSSLNMGCVTFLSQYFADGQLNLLNFEKAIQAAEQQLQPIILQYQTIAWQQAVGASGTVQALQEILLAQGFDDQITLPRLQKILQQALACQQIDQLEIVGLLNDRKQVFVSGLAILIALFQTLQIETMTLAGGALREGVLYSLLPQLAQEVRSRTIQGLIERYSIDVAHAREVAKMAGYLANILQPYWDLAASEGNCLLEVAANLHELGLLIEFKNYHLHSAYILEHSDLQGFTQSQKQIIATLLRNHRAEIAQKTFCAQSSILVDLASRLTRILRLAVIFSRRRNQQVRVPLTAQIKKDVLILELPAGWLHANPLVHADLLQEVDWQQQVGWQLKIQ